MGTPYERLMAEAIPTRPAAAPKPDRPRPLHTEPWTRAEQDAHWAALCEAVGLPDARRPHLRLVDTDEPDADHERRSA